MQVKLGDEIEAMGWQTGSVIPHDQLEGLRKFLVRPDSVPTPVEADHWLVVVTQTCDLVAKTEEAEPFTEILHCKPLKKIRKQYANLQSTRWLDFKPDNEKHEALVLSAHAVADRYLIPRAILAKLVPDHERQLSRPASARILAWYALRYGRPAWPDEFVNRVSPAKAGLLEAITLLKDDIAEVRIGIADGDRELEDGQDYHVSVYFVVDEGTWQTEIDNRQAIQTAHAKFVAELNRCPGIQVDEQFSGVFSGGEFSWQLTRTTDEWNFANLTHQE